MQLSDMIFAVRRDLMDFEVKRVPEIEIVMALNEAKNVIYQLLRDSRQNFFITSTDITLNSTTREYNLPADFTMEKTIENLQIDASVEFRKLDFASETFRTFRWGSTQTQTFVNTGVIYYDFKRVGNQPVLTMAQFPPAMLIRLHYFFFPADLVTLTDVPAMPDEAHPVITAWAARKVAFIHGLPQAGYLKEELDDKRLNLAQSIEDGHDFQFEIVEGFME